MTELSADGDSAEHIVPGADFEPDDTRLVAENLLLRPQVVVLRRQVKRPRLRPFDRWLLATLAGRFRDLLTAEVPNAAGRNVSFNLDASVAGSIADSSGFQRELAFSAPSTGAIYGWSMVINVFVHCAMWLDVVMS